MRTDTERLDWLETSLTAGWEIDDWRLYPDPIPDPLVRFWRESVTGAPEFTPSAHDLRSAIDAAMDAEAYEGGEG